MTTSSVPLALDDAENNTHNVASNRTINLGSGGFITAMTAAVVEDFSFIFVAFVTPNGENVIIGVSALVIVPPLKVDFPT